VNRDTAAFALALDMNALMKTSAAPAQWEAVMAAIDRYDFDRAFALIDQGND